MTENNADYDIPFYQMVMSLQAASMQQMGKIASPLTGKIERDLGAAKASIDMLEMLQKKTAGNLNDDEKNVLERFLYELRINYVDEVNKGEAETGEEEKSEGKQPDTPDEEKSSPEDK